IESLASSRSPTRASDQAPEAPRRSSTWPVLYVTIACSASGTVASAGCTTSATPTIGGSAFFFAQPPASTARAAASRKNPRAMRSTLREPRERRKVLTCGRMSADERQLATSAGPLEGVFVGRSVAGRVHAEAADGAVEERPRGFGVGAFAAAADAEARVVELAAAGVADAVQDALGPQRQGGADALFEDLFDRAGKAQEDESGAARSRRVRRLEDLRDVGVGEPGDDRRDVHADVDARLRQPLDGLHPSLRS